MISEISETTDYIRSIILPFATHAFFSIILVDYPGILIRNTENHNLVLTFIREIHAAL